ncbi:hypothetical protein Sfum_1914 [Syntrophobacter fumaroxidans MPOB]|uniref:Uncharacterized protein n=1 Tax=Syntrophobacter fumaroxidans (strain DSM 10017 / MPOB) TaxID=335543 RepID=A0LJJ7_SYNFM|nr:hypothetical protein Sfum_1914 [Syntrophobacter fumaroxidans MPOB]
MPGIARNGAVADIIQFKDRGGGRGDNVIVRRPLEFRRGEWRSGFVMMCTREESGRFEAHREDALRAEGHRHVAFVPDHITLDGGLHFTVMGLYRHRDDEASMRRVYRLAAMMECVTKEPSPILRTDLLRRFYKTITEERDALRVIWRGSVQDFLLPVHPVWYDLQRFGRRVAGAGSLKALYDVIREESDAQFDVLSLHYVFYLPESFVG